MSDGSGLLKRDLFGSVSLEHTAGGQVVLRDTGAARPGLGPLARSLARREARALARLAGLAGTPRLIAFDGTRLRREWIAGEPMQRARPTDAVYYREALALLRRLHRRGVTHNDLAKETNWIVTDCGLPALVDFQLAVVHRRRGKAFRSLAREDVRHLLKHKRTYRGHALTVRQRQVLATPSPWSRAWMATGKRLYRLVTRRWMGWADREGAGDRELTRPGDLGLATRSGIVSRPGRPPTMNSSHICHEHNLSRPMPGDRPYGVRITLRAGDPFAKLVGQDWHKEHWFATARERDEAMTEMSRRYPFFRPGDEPALTFQPIERQP